MAFPPPSESNHQPIASIPRSDVRRERYLVSIKGAPIDELHLFTKSSEIGIGLTPDVTALLSGMHKILNFVLTVAMFNA